MQGYSFSFMCTFMFNLVAVILALFTLLESERPLNPGNLNISNAPLITWMVLGYLGCNNDHTLV